MKELTFAVERGDLIKEISVAIGKTPKLVKVTPRGDVTVQFHGNTILTADDTSAIEAVLKKKNPNIKFKNQTVR